MGVVGSKSPLERRNTVLRRSQRKSIHGVKSKAEKLAKDIRKFKGTEENTDYVELKARIETAERELRTHSKGLQPQIRNIYAEALKKTEDCYKLLEDKLKENQDKVKAVPSKKDDKEEHHDDNQEKDDDDEVFVEEVNEVEQTPERRKTVELKVIQVEQIEASPQTNKRLSAMKLGVPVLPGTILESIHRKTEESNLHNEEKIAAIRKEIEVVESEISQFVGRRNGIHYNRIKRQLENYSADLHTISTSDEDILEQLKLCSNYIGSCVSFLDEKALDDDVDGDDDDDYDEVPSKSSDVAVPETNLSPRSIRTTYI